MNSEQTIEIKLVLPKLLFPSLMAKPPLLLQLMSDQQQAQLKDFLFDKLADKDGAPEFIDFEVLNLSFDEQTKQGAFRLKFRINRSFCCSDFDSCADDYIDFNFQYKQEMLLASGSYFNWNLDN